MVITTKICAKCHQAKPVSEFNKDKSRKGGYYIYCRECAKVKQKESYKRQEDKKILKAEKVIGGYKVAILNHPSRTERKFNIVGTDGYYYATNEANDFMDILRGLVWKTRS